MRSRVCVWPLEGVGGSGSRVAKQAEVQVAAAGEPIYKKWWFWTVLGAVAAGVVIPTVILTRGKAEPAHFDGQPITLP